MIKFIISQRETDYCQSMSQTLEVCWDPNTSIGTVDVSMVRGVYNGTTFVRDALIWTGYCTTNTTTQSIFTVNLTSDGTTTGPSLFSEIFSITAQHVLNTTTAGNACFAILRTISAGLKVATLLAVEGGGFNTVSGRTFQITVIGVAA